MNGNKIIVHILIKTRDAIIRKVYKIIGQEIKETTDD